MSVGIALIGGRLPFLQRRGVVAVAIGIKALLEIGLRRRAAIRMTANKATRSKDANLRSNSTLCSNKEASARIARSCSLFMSRVCNHYAEGDPAKQCSQPGLAVHW